MEEFAGAFGDRRRAKAMGWLSRAVVEQGSVVVRQLGADRRGEIAAHRVLSSPAVTPAETLACLARRTAAAAAGRRVVAVQDTTEINFPGLRRGDLGVGGRGGGTAGFLVHATVAVDVETESVLGVVDAAIWTRRGEVSTATRRQRQTEAKESQRWLDAAAVAGVRLGEAAELIVVGDRESDIYALFAERPERVHLVVRAGQDRALADATRLFAAAAGWPDLGEQEVVVAPRGPGDRGRTAKVVLRAGTVSLCRPRHGLQAGLPETVTLTLVEAIETRPPAGVAPLHWRLLTTQRAASQAEAAEVVKLYRLRWRIEQTFRMLKSDGVRLDETQTRQSHRLFNLAALALGAAVRIIQLVDARGGSRRPGSDVATETEIAAAAALCGKLEGRTERQRNPHPPRSLAWLSWIVARLGGWNCYYKPPGPKTMRTGWDRFAAIAEGYALAPRQPPAAPLNV